VDKEEQWKNSRSNGKIYLKALSKVLERSFAKTQSKRAYKIRDKTRFMEETRCFCQETIWKHKVCGGIFG
jgi:hypothetical protein